MNQFDSNLWDWYDSNKQLPAIYGEYLIIHKYTGVLSKKYSLEVVFYDDNGTWWGNKSSYSSKEVLAWCELPPLPSFLEDIK